MLVLYIKAPETSPVNAFLSVVVILGGNINILLASTPETFLPASAKSTAHFLAVAPTVSDSNV